jgi:c-di-GMP-binding flagellar brake protein YcgR
MDTLPLTINEEIVVQSIKDRALRVRSRILGARLREFIIINYPAYRLSERLTGELEGQIECRFVHEGTVYGFLSKIRKHMTDGITLIDYPEAFQELPLRKHDRIRVNIETQLFLPRESTPLKVVMNDISMGGCKITIPALFAMTSDSTFLIRFTLPNNDDIDNLRVQVRSVRQKRLRKQTEVGLSFVEPLEDILKISSFCHFCMFFDV